MLAALVEPLAFFTICCGMQTAWTLTALAKFLPPFTSLCRMLTAWALPGKGCAGTVRAPQMLAKSTGGF